VNGPMPARSADDTGGMGRAILNQAVVIRNPLGLHVRAARKFVETARRFGSAVTVRNAEGTRRADGRSISDLILLAAPVGTELIVEVHGDDAPAALPALADVLAAPSADDGDDVAEPAT
jgi:phosphotransferase system HPr (HPr) family protein